MHTYYGGEMPCLANLVVNVFQGNANFNWIKDASIHREWTVSYIKVIGLFKNVENSEGIVHVHQIFDNCERHSPLCQTLQMF